MRGEEQYLLSMDRVSSQKKILLGRREPIFHLFPLSENKIVGFMFIVSYMVGVLSTTIVDYLFENSFLYSINANRIVLFFRFNSWSPSSTPWCLSSTTVATKKVLPTLSCSTHSSLWRCSWTSTVTPTTWRKVWQKLAENRLPSNRMEPWWTENKNKMETSWSVKTELSSMKMLKGEELVARLNNFLKTLKLNKKYCWSP